MLVMAYGTPATHDDIEGYYTHIRRGRRPAPEQLADLVRRYDAIGGLSPLAERTRAQVDGLQAVLDRAEPGRFLVAYGGKHAAPFVEDGVGRLVEAGVTDLVALVLAPHYSALSVGEYFDRVAAAVDGAGAPLGITYVRDWYAEPGLIELLAERVRSGLACFPGGARVETLVTAHSLPQRVLEMADPYPEQLESTAAAVALAAGAGRWQVAWQSAGRTAEPWLGPDVLEAIRALAGRVDGVLVCPAGFVSDHLEVLYDLDIEARAVAEAAGLGFRRTESLNDDPRFLAVLAGVVRSAAP